MKKALQKIYADIRAGKAEAQRKRIKDALASSPALAELDEARARVLFDLSQGKCAQKEAAERLDAISARQAEALSALGLPPDYLSIEYECPVCRDTGYVGADGHTKCACQLQKAALLLKDTLINSRETFESFDESIFADEVQRKRTLRAKALCEQYADALPHPTKRNLLLMGHTGVGKSFLSNAVAYRAITRGVDAHRLTAYQFAQDMLSDIRSGSGNANRCKACELFVLDDLGTEPVIPNVSNEWLFTVLNERILYQRATIIATNLSFDDLQTRYGERLTSRLMDRRTTDILLLTGRDLRVKPC